MKRKTIIQVFIACAIFLSACQKNTDIFVPDAGQPNGPDTAWYSTITPAMPVSTLKNNIAIAPYQDTVIAGSNAATLAVSSLGLQLTFPPNCFLNASAQIVSGKVDVELRTIKTKGDMIKLNKPSSSSGWALASAGEIFVSLSKNSQPIHLAPGARYNIRYTEGVPNPLMKFFKGDESNPNKFNWLDNPDLANNTLIPGSQAYEIYTNTLGWINCAYFYDSSIARVNVVAKLAPYFTNANTIAFTVFKDVRSVVGMYGDVSTKKFSTGLLPGGKAVTVVVISRQANDYYLGFETVITSTQTAGNIIQPVPVNPIKKSLADILYYLGTL